MFVVGAGEGGVADGRAAPLNIPLIAAAALALAAAAKLFAMSALIVALVAPAGIVIGTDVATIVLSCV